MKEIIPFIHPSRCLNLADVLDVSTLDGKMDLETIESIAYDYVFSRVESNKDEALNRMRDIFNPNVGIYGVPDILSGDIFIYVSPVPCERVYFLFGSFARDVFHIE